MEMLAVATFTLVAGLVDDLRSRKVHNALILAMLPFVFLLSFYFRGLDGSLLGLGAMVGALIVTLPLFMLGILGGGDVKLFALFSFCLDPMSMFWTLIYSFLWGAAFGVTRAALQKNLLSLVRTTYKASRQRVEKQELHKMPYTFSLLLGWFTQLTLLHAGGLL
jgi:Flp pilus assembly protein protease CpaA